MPYTMALMTWILSLLLLYHSRMKMTNKLPLMLHEVMIVVPMSVCCSGQFHYCYLSTRRGLYFVHKLALCPIPHAVLAKATFHYLLTERCTFANTLTHSHTHTCTHTCTHTYTLAWVRLCVVDISPPYVHLFTPFLQHSFTYYTLSLSFDRKGNFL